MTELGLDPDLSVVTPEVPTIDFFAFELGQALYAVVPTTVDHVTPMKPAVPIPTAPPHIVGVVHVRGQIVTVVDLMQVLEVADGSGPVGRDRLLVMDVDGCRFGFQVDQILGLQSAADVRQSSDSERSSAVSGEVDGPLGVITLLDAERLLKLLQDWTAG